MNNALTQDDLTDLAAIKRGASNPDGSWRNLRVREIDDGGSRLIALRLATVIDGHLALTEAGHVELEERGL